MAKYHGLARIGITQWELRIGERVAVIRRNGPCDWIVYPPGVTRSEQRRRLRGFRLMSDAINAGTIALSGFF